VGFRPITKLLGGVRVPKEVVEEVNRIRSRVDEVEVLSKSLLIPESDWGRFRVDVPGAGFVHLMVVRHRLPKVDLRVFRGGVVLNVSRGVDVDLITIMSEGAVLLS